MTNKLETPLSKQDLGSLFSQKVEGNPYGKNL